MLSKGHVQCTNCGTTDHRGQWWYLGNYFGLSGTFCPKCYDKVSHDSYGIPRNPNLYVEILKKLTTKNQ